MPFVVSVSCQLSFSFVFDVNSFSVRKTRSLLQHWRFLPSRMGRNSKERDVMGERGLSPDARFTVAALDGSVLVTRILCVEQRLSRHYAHENKINEP